MGLLSNSDFGPDFEGAPVAQPCNECGEPLEGDVVECKWTGKSDFLGLDSRGADVYVDDVWSGGRTEGTDYIVPFHAVCVERHSYWTPLS